LGNGSIDFLVLRSTGVDIEIAAIKKAETGEGYESSQSEVDGERQVLVKFDAATWLARDCSQILIDPTVLSIAEERGHHFSQCLSRQGGDNWC
jgi:hypothetical protein